MTRSQAASPRPRPCLPSFVPCLFDSQCEYLFGSARFPCRVVWYEPGQLAVSHRPKILLYRKQSLAYILEYQYVQSPAIAGLAVKFTSSPDRIT